jgi:iron complex outermembrane receptor protein
MKKIFTLFTFIFSAVLAFGNQVDTTMVALDEIVVSSFYQSSSVASVVIDVDDIVRTNYGQEPSNVFSKMPSIISLNDNGTEFGYGYYRIRGLDQTRINVTLDGCPWNEAEDYGSYFANSPDLMSSMRTIRVERGSGSSYNGIAGVAGGIMLESINVFDEFNESYSIQDIAQIVDEGCSTLEMIGLTIGGSDFIVIDGDTITVYWEVLNTADSNYELVVKTKVI